MRFFHKRRMLRAIKEAAGNASMTDGLRAIRRFEKVNGICFDPTDSHHRFLVYKCGEHERFFRKMHKVLAR